MPISVLVADDHPLVRRGIVGFLSSQPDLGPVLEAGTGAEAVELARRHVPDVVVVDLEMPEGGGLHVISVLAKEGSPSRLIVLTSHSTDADILPAIRAGALSYLLKDMMPEDLADAIRSAVLGDAVLHPVVAARLVEHVRSGPADQPDALRDLSVREFEVLGLIARGHTNAEIAAELVISERTVKTHVSAVLTKLGVMDRTQAAVHAWEHGVVRRRPGR